MAESRWNPTFSSDAALMTQTRYSRLQLLRNPFPSVGVAPDSPPIGPTQGVARRLQQLLHDFIANRTNHYIGIVGDYGFGKSQILRLLHELMQRPEFPMRPKLVYVASAGYELYSLLRSILDNFGRDELTKTIWRKLLDDFRSNAKGRGHSWVATNFAEGKEIQRYGEPSPLLHDQGKQVLSSGWIDEQFIDYRVFLQEFVRRRLSLKRLREYGIRYLSRELKCSPFLAAELYDATDSDYVKSQTAWDRLTVPGEKGAPYKENQEVAVMQTLLTLVEWTGSYDSFVLLVDEFEATVSSTLQRKQQETYQRSLRMLLDRFVGVRVVPLMVVLAMTKDARATVQALYPGINDRLTFLELPAADISTAIEVISNYLALERISTSSPLSALFPLTEEAVSEIVAALPTKSLRELVLYTRLVIELLAEDETISLPAKGDVVTRLLQQQ
jgi:hypothetical protein